MSRDLSEEEGVGKVPLLFLSRLSLTDFRIYDQLELEPSPGLNLVAGPNAQGKTSLIEALALVSTGRLLRGSKDVQAIRHGCETASVEGILGQSLTRLTVELRRGTRKRALLNGMGLPRPSDLLGRLPSVSFSATDLEIVSGEPQDRRQFLDWEIAQLSPAYLRHLTVYKRALEQRNALLRQAQDTPVSASVFEPWESQLSDHGGALRETRTAWIDELSRDAAEAHARLGGGEELCLQYDIRDEGDVRSSRAIDIQRGSTSVGPHRDDLVIRVAGQEARYFASQGQQRTAVIALKLAVLAAAERHFKQSPVLLLDDVFSDLDRSRRSQLMELTLGRGGQVFLTCTEADQVGFELIESSTIFQVESGRVSRR